MGEGQEKQGEALLDQAEQALKTGHFAAARRLLARAPEGSDGRRQSLWARLSPDPMIPWLVGLCLLLYVAIVASTAHAH